MITYKQYKYFTDIEETTRKLILRKLGISGGTMRYEAKRDNPACVVAFDGTTPVGWATLKHKPLEIHTFVSKKYRRQGIGTQLVKFLTAGLPNGIKVNAYPYNDFSEKFFENFKEVDIILEYEWNEETRRREVG